LRVKNRLLYDVTTSTVSADVKTIPYPDVITSDILTLIKVMDDRGSRVRFPSEAGNFSIHHRVQNGLGPTQLAIQLVPGALSLGVKRPGREADHSPPSSAEVEECVELYLHSQYVFMAWCLVKYRDNFTFTFHHA
jgi:hypothetical protein